MCQPAEHLRLEREALAGVIGDEPGWHHLQRHGPARLLLLGQVHGAYAAGPEDPGLFVNGIGQVGAGGGVPGPVQIVFPSVPGASLLLHTVTLLYSPQRGWHFASNPLPVRFTD